MGPVLKPAQYLEWPGFALVAMGAVLFALFTINVKKLQNKGLPSDVITTLYCLMSGTAFFAVSFLFNPPKIWSVFDLNIGVFWPLFATCALNVVIQFGNTRAQEYADPSMTVAVGALQPFISLLPAWLVLGETPNNGGYLGLLFIASGIYIISLTQKIKDPAKVPDWGKTAEGKLRFTAPLAALFTNKGMKLAFLATACGAVSVNFDKKAALLSSYTFAPAIILIFVGLVGVLRAKREAWQKLKFQHIKWLCFISLLYFLTNVLYWYAFHYGLAMYISALKRLNTIFILPLSYWMLKTEITKDKKYWTGTLLFVSGLFLFTIPD